MTIRPTSAGPASVLIVDDDAPMRRVFRELLESQSYVVVEAGDGRTALQVLEFENVGLVLLDMMMAGLDGPEVCSIIRTRANRPYLPVVMVSGLADRASRVRAREAGADDYFTKPVDTLELLIRVEALYRAREKVETFSHEAQSLKDELTEVRAQLERASTRATLIEELFRDLRPLSAQLRGSIDALRKITTSQLADSGVAWSSVDEQLARLEGQFSRFS